MHGLVKAIAPPGRPFAATAIASIATLLLPACGSGEVGGTPSASASPGRNTHASADASTTAAPGASSSAASASSSLTAQEFCAQTVQLGEENMAGAAASERANITSLDHVKPLSSVPKECSMRVESPNVEFHGDVAYRCIEAARARRRGTTLFTFEDLPECRGVLTGKATDGQPALFAEECATGFALLSNRCVKPVAKNGTCDASPGGILGNADDHPRCEPGLDCFKTRYSADGNPAEYACLTPSDIGASCKLALNTCARGSSCYQGKCRALSDVDGDCMAETDCRPGNLCSIKGGVFGKCVKQGSNE